MNGARLQLCHSNAQRLGGAEAVEVRPGVAGGNDFFAAQSPAMREVLQRASKIARLETPVLIDGEPGVGKGSLARHIHRLSRRSQGPLICMACASLHEPDLDERLFGQVGWSGRPSPSVGDPARKWQVAAAKSQSLLESAHGGTLFLDEVSQLPTWAQTKLFERPPAERITGSRQLRERDA